jgi:chromosome segregation ATPase
MTVGQIAASGMGINELNSESLINFIIYGIFIFIMPILFINIFTGIAIDEIRQLVDNSKIEIISAKIEFVYKIEPLREYMFFKILESFLKWIDESLGKMKKNIEKFNYLTKAIEDFRKTKLEKEEKDEIKDMLIEQEDKISKLLNELKQNSSLMQSQFNLIDKKLDKKMNNMEEQIKVLNKMVNKTEPAAGKSKDKSDDNERNNNTLLDEVKLIQIKIESMDEKFEKIVKREEKHRKKEQKTEIQTENKDLTQVEPRYLDIHKK